MNPKIFFCLALFGTLGASSRLDAQALEWEAHLAPDLRWVTDGPTPFGNWTPQDDPTGGHVIFGANGLSSSSSVVTNTLDESLTVGSLLYSFDSASQWHVTEILEGVTLGVSGTAKAFTVGGMAQATATTTQVAFRGGGSLEIDQPAGEIFLGNQTTSGSTPSVVVLDMSALGAFKANLGPTGSALNIGTTTTESTPSNQRTRTVVRLAAHNEITATTLRISAVISGSQVHALQTTQESVLYLGEENTLHLNRLDIGLGYTSLASGALRFDPESASPDATVRLRGIGGGEDDAVAQVRIGYNAGGTTANSQSGIADFSGGTVDALVEELVLGSGLGSAGSSASGTLTMDQGLFRVLGTTVAGQNRAGGGGTAGTSPSTGKLEIKGGTFETTRLVLAESTPTAPNTTANRPVEGSLHLSGDGQVVATDGIVMGRHGAATSPVTITALIDLQGGSLTTLNGGIAEGAQGATPITSTVHLRGGKLDLGGHALSVDDFIAESGELANVSQLNGGTPLAKTGLGTLLLSGIHGWSNTVDITAGSVQLEGSLAHANITVRENAGFSLLSGGSLRFGLEDVSTYDTFILEAGGEADFSGTLRLSLDMVSLPQSAIWQLFDGTSADQFANLEGIYLEGALSLALHHLESNLWGAALGDQSFTLDLQQGAFTIATIPEPSSGVLLGLAGGGLLLALKRRHARRSRSFSHPMP